MTARAPGKIILFGEHAVVYGQPAIAVPVNQVQALASFQWAPDLPPGGYLYAPQVNMDHILTELTPENPVALTFEKIFSFFKFDPRNQSFRIEIISSIPVAAGLGSGAAVSVALIRGLAEFLGQPVSNEAINQLVFDIEKIHHGTPSGIDNTVITYNQPVYFVREQPIVTFEVKVPFTLIIGDTGIASSTGETVADVRRGVQANKLYYETIFSEIGSIAQEARRQIQQGNPAALGPLMNQNHDWLQAMDVSSIELDRLVNTARQAGALGAKLSGGGRGGNMIALVDPANAKQVAEALLASGATHTLITQIGS